MILWVDSIVLVVYASSMTSYTPVQSSSGEVESLESYLKNLVLSFGALWFSVLIKPNFVEHYQTAKPIQGSCHWS